MWRRVPDYSLNSRRGYPSRSRVAGVTDSDEVPCAGVCRGSRFRVLCYASRMLTMRGVRGGMLALLLVNGVAGAQTPPVRPRAQTVSTDTPAIAALRLKANAGDAFAQLLHDKA